MFVFLNITNLYKLQFKEINQLEKSDSKTFIGIELYFKKLPLSIHHKHRKKYHIVVFSTNKKWFLSSKLTY